MMALTSRRAGLGSTPMGRERSFDIALKLQPTGELFTLKGVHNEMKISELQNDAEFATGVPMYMQVLTYLDEGKPIMYFTMQLMYIATSRSPRSPTHNGSN